MSILYLPPPTVSFSLFTKRKSSRLTCEWRRSPVACCPTHGYLTDASERVNRNDSPKPKYVRLWRSDHRPAQKAPKIYSKSIFEVMIAGSSRSTSRTGSLSLMQKFADFTSPFVALIISIEYSSSSILSSRVCRRKPCCSVVNTRQGWARLSRAGSQFHRVRNWTERMIRSAARSTRSKVIRTCSWLSMDDWGMCVRCWGVMNGDCRSLILPCLLELRVLLLLLLLVIALLMGFVGSISSGRDWNRVLRNNCSSRSISCSMVRRLRFRIWNAT